MDGGRSPKWQSNGSLSTCEKASSLPQRASRYDQVALEIFRSKYHPGDSEVRFTREELLGAAGRIGVQVKNPGDFPYYYAKRHVLPAPIRTEGFTSLEIVGHSSYDLTKAMDAIDAPQDLPEADAILTLPSRVRDYLTDDQQEILVNVREADISS